MIYINEDNRNSFIDKNGKHHRVVGPAYFSDKHKQWWLNGELHRLDGPAIIDENYVEWYINNKEYTETGYYRKIKELGL